MEARSQVTSELSTTSSPPKLYGTLINRTPDRDPNSANYPYGSIHDKDRLSRRGKLTHNDIGALIIRLGFWGILYYNYNKEPRK